jgi:uncharacterized membrane protein
MVNYPGGLFGLAAMCASGVVSSWSMAAIGRHAKVEQIIALEGYQSGISILFFAIGSLTILGIIKSRHPDRGEQSDITP